MKKLLFFLIVTAAIMSSCSQDETIPEEKELTEQEEIIQYINEIRTVGYKYYTWKDGIRREEFISTKELNLSELSWDNYLYEASLIQAEHMYNTGEYEHIWSDGTNLDARLKMVGCDYASSGENICKGVDNSKDAIYAWLLSDEHRHIMLFSEWNVVGMGKKGECWSMVFAIKPSK